MRYLRAIHAALSLVALAYAACDSRNQVSSWENQTFIDAGLQTPSSPSNCLEIWNHTEAVDLAIIRKSYGITKYNLEAWNCFLDTANGMSIPNVGYCVRAEPVSTWSPLPPPTMTEPPKKPTIPQPVESIPPPTTAVNVLAQYEEESNASGNETTAQSTPHPLLTTYEGVTVSNPVFDIYAKHETMAVVPPSSKTPYNKSDDLDPVSPYNGTNQLAAVSSVSRTTDDHRTWSTVTLPQEVTPIPAELGTEPELLETPGNVFLARNDSSSAPFKPGSEAWSKRVTTTCGSGQSSAEKCPLTRDCDPDYGEYPFCENGDCKCKKKFCSSTPECEKRKQCR